jgi:hypothetical protein
VNREPPASTEEGVIPPNEVPSLIVNNLGRPSSLHLPTYSSSEWTDLHRPRKKPRELMERLRFLLGVLLYEEQPSEDVTIETFDLVFRLGSVKEATFVRKYGFLLFLLLGIGFQDPVRATNAVRSLKQTFPRLLPHSREYFGKKHQPPQSSLVLIWRRPKRFSPKRVIGVGYNDSGCLKDHAQDGNPHWSEIASDEVFQDSQPTRGHSYISPVMARNKVRHWSN